MDSLSAVQVRPPSVDVISGTPATCTRVDSSGSTQILPNHQPKVDCEDASSGSSGSLVHVVPASAEV
jgi:hypothetical protein